MLKQQRGATLLEAVLAAAIIGWGLAFAGAQLIKSAKNKQIDKNASKLINFQYEVKQLASTVYFNVIAPGSGASSKKVNPLLVSSSTGKFMYEKDLRWMKQTDCELLGGISGQIPVGISRPFVDCDYSPDFFGVEYIGTEFTFVPYNLIKYPSAKRFITSAQSYYVNKSNVEVEDILSIISKLSDQKRDDGFSVSDNDIIISKFVKLDDVNYREVPDTAKSWAELIDNISLLDSFIKEVTSGDNYLGFRIKSFYNEDIYLKRDGSIPMSGKAKLCWDGYSGKEGPCLSASSESDGTRNYLIADGGFAFGEKIKRTPIEISYKTFSRSNRNNIEIPYLNCPQTEPVMLNKMVAIPSSFSSGSEERSDFSDPNSIKSYGTKGASNKHAFISGVSMEWAPVDSRKVWTIKGGIGIDGAYEKDNGNSSMLNNPLSMSFIVMQWCEEKPKG
ncbi:toxin coregulated pilus biosynthesis protein TcpB [Aliivibrio fischeri ES114]|uniref:Toxin coregulated pilus biosynthesis protein TcpB n=1 Tax=Aliivibrio fischeri (strain ATCC 700601 / ES114) TaxID=312309 RepID=Q5DZ52_ALIF1|nr:toxin-coregulated pilus minor pilin TcpB [Aliivibrio fischeri]AAW87944.1 toxin coregulated pilus biosynthesis protein TcpB [Aliivibrio fischeri ES114]KLU80428.1 hypothetical protein AB192_00960 [Aliivibrio fischeri]